MKIILGRQIEEIKKKNSENEKNLLKNRNSDELNEVDADDIYFHSNTIKNIKLGTNVVNRIYLNNSIVYELQDTIDLNLFHSLVPAATATSIFFDKLENQDISNYNLIGYCDANNYIAVYNNNKEYLVLNIRNAVIYSPNYSDYFFYNYNVLKNCVFSNFNTSSVTYMHHMFESCRSLTRLDLSSFNTQNVANMQYMFSSCSGLTSLDLSNFNTGKVTSINYMFYNCSSLLSLDLSSFNMQNTTSMYATFFGCNNLPSLDLRSFNTKNVTTMQYMFYNCCKVTSLNLSNFNTQKVTRMVEMFYNCNILTTIISNTFDITSSAASTNMFLNCTSLVGGNGTTYNSSHVTAEYARVDGENGLPGYFTAPANK